MLPSHPCLDRVNRNSCLSAKGCRLSNCAKLIVVAGRVSAQYCKHGTTHTTNVCNRSEAVIKIYDKIYSTRSVRSGVAAFKSLCNKLLIQSL